MKCPQCGNEMISGKIPANKFKLKFIPDYNNGLINDELYHHNTFGGYISLTTNSFLINKSFKCYYCKNCKMIVGHINIKNK